MAPPLVAIINRAVAGESPAGTDVIRRVQFVPSPDLPTATPMTRGEGPGWMTTWRPTSTAAKPARTTRITITRTTTIAVRLLVEGGAGVGVHIGG